MTGSSFKDLQVFFNQNFQTAEYQLDLYTLFIEHSEKIVTKEGMISLITPNSWLKNIKMQKTRKFILENLEIQSLNPNISKAFDEAQVDTLIFTAKKGKNGSTVRVWTFNEDNEVAFRHDIESNSFENNVGLTFDVEVNPEIRSIIVKVRTQSKYFEDVFDITRGVNPYDKYRGQSEDIIKSKAYHSDSKKDESFVPELRGKHVSTFKYKWDEKHYISYGDWLAAPRDPKYFKGPRIILREIIGERLVCAIVEEDFIIDRSLYIAKLLIPTNSIYTALGLLASKLMIWLFKYEKNEFDELFPKLRLEEFKKLPIPINNEYEKEIDSLVRQIILAKQSDDNQSDTSALESEVDRLVYGLYGLGEEEVAVIEGEKN